MFWVVGAKACPSVIYACAARAVWGGSLTSLSPRPSAPPPLPLSGQYSKLAFNLLFCDLGSMMQKPQMGSRREKAYLKWDSARNSLERCKTILACEKRHHTQILPSPVGE